MENEHFEDKFSGKSTWEFDIGILKEDKEKLRDVISNAKFKYESILHSKENFFMYFALVFPLFLLSYTFFIFYYGEIDILSYPIYSIIVLVLLFISYITLFSKWYNSGIKLVSSKYYLHRKYVVYKIPLYCEIIKTLFIVLLDNEKNLKKEKYSGERIRKARNYYVTSDIQCVIEKMCERWDVKSAKKDIKRKYRKKGYSREYIDEILGTNGVVVA